MNLIFPFKNIALNGLLDFVEKEMVKDYFKHKDGDLFYDYYENRIKIYKEQIPDYENEILQITETSSQETIDKYFDELINNVLYAKDLIEEDNIKRLVKEWNDEELKAFEKKIVEQEEKYFQSENRKLKHLEEYEESQTLFPILGLGRRLALDKRKKVNYNFYCVEEKPDLIDESRLDDYIKFIRELYHDFLDVAKKYGVPWQEGKIKSKLSTVHLKPIIFFEGETDLDYVKKAASLLGEGDLLDKVELRQRGSSSNLTKLWTVLKENNWETVPQTKMFIYDCDTNRENARYGHLYSRTIPKQENLIAKGTENLFTDTFIKKAIEAKREFVDFKEINGTERGKSYRIVENTINKDEKRNFCNWACEHGQADDFKNFKIVFDLIREVV